VGVSGLRLRQNDLARSHGLIGSSLPKPGLQSRPKNAGTPMRKIMARERTASPASTFDLPARRFSKMMGV
jgi:hypothetical protein